MKISIIVLVSKAECVDLVRENLNRLDLGNNYCELVVMIDNNQIGSDFAEEFRPRFPQIKVKKIDHAKPQPTNIDLSRDRIAQVRNESRELVGETDYVFSFEDDSVIPSNAMVKLIDGLNQQNIPANKRVGLISGIQVGRQGLRILGAWFADNAQFPTEFTTLGKNEVVTPLAEVSGTGMYCYLTPTSLYKEATYGWYPPVGPDVYYGLWLRMKGYKVYVDQSVVAGHRIPNKTLTPDNVDIVKIRYTKDKHGNWSFEQIKKKA